MQYRKTTQLLPQGQGWHAFSKSMGCSKIPKCYTGTRDHTFAYIPSASLVPGCFQGGETVSLERVWLNYHISSINFLA